MSTNDFTNENTKDPLYQRKDLAAQQGNKSFSPFSCLSLIRLFAPKI